MYKCDHCGGDLIFDPANQKMTCKSCGSHYPITPERDKELEVAEDGTFETEVFNCPNCGGRLVGVEESVVSFCPFCGSQVQVPTEKIHEKLPELIVPFSVDKRFCRNIYKNQAKKFIFAPSEMKSDEFIDRVQGVYVPYWSYVCHFDGQASAEVVHSVTSGNYVDKDYYMVTKQVGGHAIVSKDASRSLDDELSIGAGSFSDNSIQYFTPQYLSGFYADLPDVDPQYYFDEAGGEARKKVVDKVFDKGPNDSIINVNDRGLQENIESRRAAMPMYFLTWRDKNKVSYSLINGQTGTLSAKLPVDLRKFFLISLLFALPFFFVLFFMNVTIMPRTIATLSGILLVVSMFLTYRTGTSAILKEKVFFGYPLDKKMQQQREKMKRQFANLIFPTASTFIIFIVLIVHEVSLNSGFGRFVVSLFIVIFGIINIVRLFKGAFEAGACAQRRLVFKAFWYDAFCSNCRTHRNYSHTGTHSL